MRDTKGSSLLLVILLLGLVIFSTIFIFYYRNSKSNDLNQSEKDLDTFNYQTNQQKVASLLDSIEWTTFNSQLGFSFQYPSHWGTPQEKITIATETNQGDSGKLYSLVFSENADVQGSGRSTEFSAGRGSTWGDFSGYDDKDTGAYAYLDITAPGCFLLSNSFLATVDFNLPGKEISGVRL